MTQWQYFWWRQVLNFWNAMGRTGLLNSLGLPLLRPSKFLIKAGHAPAQWHSCTRRDWKMPGSPRYGRWLYRVKSLRPRGPGGAVLPCAEVFKCFAEHGKSSPLVAGAPFEVQPDKLFLAVQMQQQAAFDAVPLDPQSCLGPGVKLRTYRRWFSYATDQVCPFYWEVPMSTCKVHCKVAEIPHGVSFAANCARPPSGPAPPQTCV